MDKPVSPDGFIQINIVVKDIAAAAEMWARVPGDCKNLLGCFIHSVFPGNA